MSAEADDATTTTSATAAATATATATPTATVTAIPEASPTPVEVQGGVLIYPMPPRSSAGAGAGPSTGSVGTIAFYGWLVLFIGVGCVAIFRRAWRERVVIGFPLPILVLAAGSALGLIAFGFNVHPFLVKDPELRLEFAKFVGAVLVATVGIFTVYYQHRNHQQSVQANFTERFTRAVEMLGENREEKDGRGTRPVPNLEVRLGGIHALKRLASDSKTDRPAIFEILCAYVRENSKRPLPLEADLRNPQTDVQAAITVIGDSLWNRAALPAKDRPPLDLHGANLRGANFTGLHLQFADLREANLDDARFQRANLENANLQKARLKRATVWEAKFKGAHFAMAHIEGVNFEEQVLEGPGGDSVDVDAADLTDANDIETAFGDGDTRLPNGMTCRRAEPRSMDFPTG